MKRKSSSKLKKLTRRLPKWSWTVALPIVAIMAVAALPLTIPKSQRITIEGNIEIGTLPYYSEVNGKIIEMPIELGQNVKAGDVLAVFENTALRDQIASLENTLLKTKLSLDQLKNGNAPASQIAGNEVEIARQQMFNTQDTYLYAVSIYEDALNRGVDAETLAPLIIDRDNKHRLFQISEWQYRSSQQGVISVAGQSQVDQIESIQADLDFLGRQLDQAQSDLAKNTIKANQGGIVVTKNFQVGALVAAGQVVAEISREDEKLAVFWIPVEFLTAIDHGKILDISNIPPNSRTTKQTIQGTINYVDWSAQYTPREVASATNQNRLSFQVKALLPEVDWRVAQKVNLTLDISQ